MSLLGILLQTINMELRELVSIQWKVQLWSQALILDETVKFAIEFSIRPKSVQWGWGPGSVQATWVP